MHLYISEYPVEPSRLDKYRISTLRPCAICTSNISNAKLLTGTRLKYAMELAKWHALELASGFCSLVGLEQNHKATGSTSDTIRARVKVKLLVV